MPAPELTDIVVDVICDGELIVISATTLLPYSRRPAGNYIRNSGWTACSEMTGPWWRPTGDLFVWLMLLSDDVVWYWRRPITPTFPPVIWYPLFVMFEQWPDDSPDMWLLLCWAWRYGDWTIGGGDLLLLHYLTRWHWWKIRYTGIRYSVVILRRRYLGACSHWLLIADCLFPIRHYDAWPSW